MRIAVAVTVGVIVEGIARLEEGSPTVLGLLMAVVSLISLAVMITGALVLGGPYWLDPVIALILSTVIGRAGIRLAIQTIVAPRGADIDFDNH
jgi:divalent metal cation (Fe/Co/Zn/Cd) transporter